MSQSTTPVNLYVGTFTRHQPHPRGNGEGISLFRMDTASGALTQVETYDDVPNPSFLTLAPDRRHLYSVNADPAIDGHPGGAVSAFSVDPSSGRLTFLNRESTHGEGPCHVSVDRTARCLITTCYGGGNVAVLPIHSDGRVGPATDVVKYTGTGPHPVSQQGPHAHSVNLDAANRFALVCNQGLDKIFIYELDPARGTITPNPRQPFAHTGPATGPRHLDFHPNGRNVYAINEQGCSVTVFAYDAANGTLDALQAISTLPETFSGHSSTADVHVHPSGRFVYGSNRGHDSLAIFAVDERTGRLTSLGHQATQGHTPRNFTFDATGSLLLVANQDSDNIVAFRVDQETGQLTSLGVVGEVVTPTCLKIVSP